LAAVVLVSFGVVRQIDAHGHTGTHCRYIGGGRVQRCTQQNPSTQSHIESSSPRWKKTLKCFRMGSRTESTRSSSWPPFVKRSSLPYRRSYSATNVGVEQGHLVLAWCPGTLLPRYDA
ncbi:unnamed protein product, partial [Ectocarpus fasciculatus]